ncbi:MAG: sodium/solute symporter [Rhodothermia bacterium]|nr:sodium/solute symporter [Rhodothermia bacterium]
MLRSLETFDFVMLFVLLLLMPTAGLWVAFFRRKSSETYFLAGRSLKWWAVAGSIFGTNINSSHLIGMLGIGYSVGFAQSHYEVLAVPAVLLLCYVFVPIYRKRQVFTLSQYLEHRYNEHARLVYTIIMILLILVQLIAGFYIGGRTIALLFQGMDFQILYWQGVMLIALVACSYTIWGGMESIVITDNIQTAMMLIAGVVVAIFTFSQPEIGGFFGLMALDQRMPLEAQKMHLYLPSNHPNLPWTGIFTGLVVAHSFYWTTNQYLVQRTLAANSDYEAKLGIIASGFLKLTVPFFSIATGVAAAYVFKSRFGEASIMPDDAFLKLVEIVIPMGWGLTGMILAGLTAATFSSVDSMMNSATTLLSLDVYKKYIKPDADDAHMLRFGRIAIFVMVAIAAWLALWTYSPSSKDNFFLTLTARQSYLTPGVVAAFFVGILWRRAHPRAAVITMFIAPFLAWGIETIYAMIATSSPGLAAMFGEKLNFLHRIFLTLVSCVSLHIGLSWLWRHKVEEYPALDLTISVKDVVKWTMLFLVLQIPLIAFIVSGWFSAQTIAFPAALIPMAIFLWNFRQMPHDEEVQGKLLRSDLFYSGLLSSCTVFILYYFA